VVILLIELYHIFSFISIETSGFLKKVAGKFLKILKKLFSKVSFVGTGQSPAIALQAVAVLGDSLEG
jgi:hypothetical protein